MKNKKLLKLLATLAMGSAMAVSVFGMAACGGKKGGDENKGDGPDIVTPDDENKATVTSVSVTAANSATSVEINKTLQLTATVTGTNNPAQTVTWSSSDTDKATVNSSGLVTGVAAGSVTITATSTVDNTKKGEITLTVKEASSEVDNAIVPEYKGPAAGPEAGSKSISYTLLSANFAENLTEAYDDGIFYLPSGTAFRNQTPNNGDNPKGYTRSIQNGTITVHVPSAGKLKFIFASGSSTVGDAKYQITINGTPQAAVTVQLSSKVLTEAELDVNAGDTIVFAKSGGTIDTYEVVLTLNPIESKPIESIQFSSAVTDYLVTQKVDCTSVKLVAKDGNNATYDIDLSHCKFDTSKYNPDVSGEYEIGVTYYLDSNLTSDTLEFNTSYKVKVYAVDSIVLDLIGLSGSTQLTAQQAYLTTDSYAKESVISVIATCDYNGDKITYKLKNNWYSLTDSIDLSVAGKKTVTVSVDNTFTIGNKDVSASYEIISAVKKDVVDNKVTVTVGEHGEFSSLTQAVQYLKKCAYAANVIKVIEIEAGTYAEKVWIDVPNVTLIGKGDDADKTVITCSLVEGDADNYSGGLWGLNCATVHVTGANFKAYNLSIRNDFDYINNSGNYSGNQAAQGLALTLDADGAVLYNCHLYGNQDTLYMKSGRSYYYKTQIDGNVDFIFGNNNGLAFFEECEIVAISRNNDQNGYVTAAKHEASNKPDYGYIFYKCNLTDDGKVKAGSMALGRPWGAAATVAYIECNFSAAYSKLAYADGVKVPRWAAMSGASPVNADFCEYNSDPEGSGAITAEVTGGKILSADQAANYTKANIFGTSNGKQSYSTAFDCDGALNELKSIVDPSAYATVTVKDTAGDVVAEFSAKKGETLSVDTVISTVNSYLESSGKEVDKVYSSYTDAGNNTEYTEVEVNGDFEIIVSLKDIQYTQKTYTLIDLVESKLTYTDSPIDIYNGELYLEFGSLNPNANSGCCIVVPGTKITLDLEGEVSLVWYNGGTDSYGKDSDAKITYKDHKATITIGNRLSQFYLMQIKIDLTKTPDDTPESQSFDVTFDLNGAEGTVPSTQTVAEGESATEPFVPVWSGHKFLGWYTDATAGEKYDFGEVTGEVNLYARWEDVTTPVVIEENSTISFGTSGNFQSYIASTALIGTTVNETKYRNNGSDNTQLSDTFSIKVKQGAVITISSYSGYTHYTLTASGAEATEQTGTSYEFTVLENDADQNYATVTFACGSNNYFYSIKIVYGDAKISTTTTLDLTGDNFAEGPGMECVKFTSGKFTANGGKVFIDDGTVIEIAVEGNPDVSFLWYDSANQPQYGTDENASVDKSTPGIIRITFTKGTASGMYLQSITLTF